MNLIFTNEVGEGLRGAIRACGDPESLFILVDENTRDVVLPRLLEVLPEYDEVPVIVIPAGDINKGIDSLAKVWKALGDGGATRSSLLINLGGGMVTDLGAFAAATFKRGIKFINIPTTLLAAVDASVGGKTGINFNGLKNEVGVFKDADAVIISTVFFDTLPAHELKSGYAEMIKHAFLTSDAEVERLLRKDITEVSKDELLDMLRSSVAVKERVVAIDPTEKGLRRSLNLGHTAGHAFETLAMEREHPIPHGYAVAYGLVVALILSHMRLKFPSRYLYSTASYVSENYGSPSFTCDDYPRLLEIMGHDKKNVLAGQISFTLLAGVGEPECGVTISPDEITAALDIYRDLIGE